MMDQKRLSLLQKTAAALFLGFVVLFLVRFALGFVVDFPRPLSRYDQVEPRYQGVAEIADLKYKKLIASNLDLREASARSQPDLTAKLPPMSQLEVYAKEARMRSETEQYEENEKQIFAAIELHQSTVRMEDRQGLKPRRSLSLVIKTPENQFEPFIAALREIGDIQELKITKEDKSEEVKSLLAQTQSLRDYRTSLENLRGRDGEVQQLIELEKQIQEVERQLRELGVQLGEFVTGGEDQNFSNVSFALAERIPFYVDEKKYPLAVRIVDALLWTIMWYALLVAAIAFLAITLAAVNTLRPRPTSTG